MFAQTNTKHRMTDGYNTNDDLQKEISDTCNARNSLNEEEKEMLQVGRIDFMKN